jgi:hypothetical protein
MQNHTADLKRGCAIEIRDIAQWSASARRFMVVPEYHPNGKAFRPFQLNGPDRVFPERSGVFLFLQFEAKGQVITGTDTGAANRGVRLTANTPGKWLVRMIVRASKMEREREAFFEIQPGKRPTHIPDPRDTDV